MDYFWSIFVSAEPSSSPPKISDLPHHDLIELPTTSFIHKTDITFPNATQHLSLFLDKFLSQKSLDNKIFHTPGGGGIHDLKDKRLRMAFDRAISERNYKDFMDDINTDLPLMLRKEMKKSKLTRRSASALLVGYLCKQ